MEEIVAPINIYKFEIELALDEQIGAQPLPFNGMDKSGAAVCEFFSKGGCKRGVSCPYRHVRGDKSVVCKHWLRGLCKKGDQCEFLHEYDMTKMPECYFYSRFSACSNKECPFLHIDPESKIRNCPWYDRGFCRHGPSCRHRHVRRTICINYLTGFCLDGPACKFLHPKFDLPIIDPGVGTGSTKKGVLLCHYCQEPGHKVIVCPNLPPDLKEEQNITRQQAIQSLNVVEKNLRPLDEVTCYKCGVKGHYANKCPKGHLAFLSTSLSNMHAGNA